MIYQGKKTLASLVTHQAEIFPERALFYYHDQPFAYKRIHETSSHAAAALKRLGIARGDRVIIGLPNSPEQLIAFVAVAKAGAIFVPTPAQFRTPEILYYLKDSEANAVIGSPDFIEKVLLCKNELKQLHVLVQVGGQAPENAVSWDELIHEPDTWDAQVTPEDPLAIYYTSGTTGEPKGAVLLNERFLNNSLKVGLPAHFSEKDVAVNTLPYTHVFAPVEEFFPMLFVGGRFVLRDAFNPRGVLEDMARYDATFLVGVPAMFMAVYDEIKRSPGKYNFDRIRFVGVGGAPMPTSLQHALEKIMDAPFVQGSGQTESGPLITHELISRPEGLHPGTCGTAKIFEDIQVRFVDDHDHDVPDGELGELIVRTPDMMAGYWRRPEETAKVMKGGWLHTGDIARIDKDGYIYLIDRKKDMIITSGHNVYPVEIENVLYGLPQIREALVIGLPNSMRGESVEAFLVVKEGQTLTERQVKTYCKEHLADFKHPRHVHFVDQFPKTVSGKIRRADFKKEMLGKVKEMQQR